MRYIIIICVAMLCFQSAADAQIKFEKGSWEKVLKKAQKKGKHIFVDCYTTWCGPCKLMDKKVFTDEQVADYYNDNFVSYKIDMESTEGLIFSSYFLASVYPTFYYLDAEGNTLQKMAGYQPPEVFINNGKQALKEPIKKKYGKIDIAAERKKEQAIRKNQFLQLVKSKGFDLEDKSWEQVVADAKASGKDILAIVGDTNWGVPDEIANEETRTYLQANFEIYAKSFSQSYLRDENGDIITDENGSLKQDEWMETYPVSVFPGIVIINAEGETLITGTMNEALTLGQAVRAGTFKPEVGFWNSMKTVDLDYFKIDQWDEAVAKSMEEKPILIHWYRPSRNVLPVYEDPKVIEAMKTQFVSVALYSKDEKTAELFKKFGGNTYGSNGSLAVVNAKGELVTAIRVPALTTSQDLLNFLEQSKKKAQSQNPQ